MKFLFIMELFSKGCIKRDIYNTNGISTNIYKEESQPNGTLLC